MSSTVPDAARHHALYRRWRAQTFSQIVGQGRVVETLRNAVRLGRVAHGLLFVGPRGTGKTSMARIVAKAVNCMDLVDGEPCDRCASCSAIRDGRAFDVVELDAASNNRVDDMRELLPRVYTAPSDLQRKVFIIDEVQRIKEGWDVLLKTLEEPPEDVHFIFCTTDPSQIRPAVVSRLQRFTFKPLSVEEIRGKLQRILDADGRAAEPAAVALVAHLAAGGMRDAESMLDQLLSGGEPLITARGVRDLLGIAEAETVDRFIGALVDDDAVAGIRVLEEMEADGRDFVAFADQVVARLRQLLVDALAAGSRGPGASPASLVAAARRLSTLDAARPGLGGVRLQLELALLEGLTRGGALPPAKVASPAATVDAAATANGRPAPIRAAAAPAPSAPAPTAAPDRAPDRHEPPRPPASGADDAHQRQKAVPSTREPAPRTTISTPALPDPQTPAPPSGASDEELFERLRVGWRDVVEHVGRNPATRPLVSACRPIEIRDGAVVLGFPEDQAFLRAIAERKRSALEDGVALVLGRHMPVRCVATNIDTLAKLAESDGDGDELVRHARRIFDADLVDVPVVE